MIKYIVFCVTLVICLVKAVVLNPHIIVPNESTVWKAGGTFDVKWDTIVYGSPIAPEVNGTIKLGYLDGTDINEHLFWTLASGFPLNTGSQSVVLPTDLVTKASYIIVLMGDSGNSSPQFTIEAN
ncbi:hypothetical protein F4703DRAFT_1865749 [Phycomyces blakesleeanus]|uniref:Yeast cell wall synthesis Kre9/Knh1-like N-terminal domain-containing protein n=1 Tax=Phycomyces blakesleeanus (strain ATCC 8743b / DSM 1359 / FGSC 10004 / NBRC 33097 / NRRL 1555) TaxID=763407 RepID=A0A163E6T7_PHYB8|nr:hypothetical protein PHYBLDRAFT_62784 [Phycomyces blakesleeanus NRRL 1555(-)]OAD77020.1 hypothetical protein PHYBLDRAFT_62784 [Phycomyces blakesleeanus NRRL 1555(-)]|eukprot:XP_018295060.1 hypothetical protein PHYBLDRAFT_62784 [Phycomyces blakesleeanus NRRL 1555(-)]